MQSPPFPITSSLLGPNILLNTMFSNTLGFLSSHNVNDQVSYPYKTTGKIIVLYILTFKCLGSNLEDKSFCTEWQQALPDLNRLLISSAIEFWFVKVVPKYLNSSTLSKVLFPIHRNWFTQRPTYDYIMGNRMSGICTILLAMSEPLQDGVFMYYRILNKLPKRKKFRELATSCGIWNSNRPHTRSV